MNPTFDKVIVHRILHGGHHGGHMVDTVVMVSHDGNKDMNRLM